MWKRLYLFDLGFLLLYFFLFFTIGGDLVHASLRIPFYAWNVLCALFLTAPSPWNPGKRIFETIFYALRRQPLVYHPEAGERPCPVLYREERRDPD